MLVFMVCAMTQARRARATVCKAGPILGIRRMNRCKGRVQSMPRVTARITIARVMPTTATKVAYFANPALPTSPNPSGSIGARFGSLMIPMTQIRNPTIRMARNNSMAGQVMEARKFRRNVTWFW